MQQTTTFQPVRFFAATDLVIAGQNPEIADYSNPNGDVIRSAAYVYAEDSKGYRVCKHINTGWEEDVLEEATKVADALNARLANGKLPVAFSTWIETRPCYGSEAYIESDQAYQDLLEERFCDEPY